MNLKVFCALALLCLDCAGAEFRAGAASVDVSPTNFPVVVNAMFTERSADRVVDRLFSKALVLDDSKTRVAIVVVDTCMMPRELIDRAKVLAARETGIAVERMLVSATHTHSAPAAMGCLGSRADTNYARFLEGKIAESIVAANAKLRPARIGHTSFEDWEHTFNRRWIRRSDRVMNDPFGEPTVRAHMHPGHESADAIGPSGPVDPELSVFAVETLEGRPLALLANYSMHYYESPLLSSDYFGKFAAEIAGLLGAGEEFVGMMSQGTSGDLMWMDYGATRRDVGYAKYAREIAERVKEAYGRIEFRAAAELKMAERKLRLKYRAPNEKRLAWAREVAEKLGGKLPQTLPEIYALEAIYLHERPETELVLQALRIGDVGIAAWPNEVFALSGLKVKARSPLAKTFNIELANGAEGYIPPVEQHRLGGYTTWPARTAGLEVGAEERIVETLVGLLEEVAEKPQRKVEVEESPLLKRGPAAMYRFEEMVAGVARDQSTNGNHATIEDGVAVYLPSFGGVTNRAFHFAGGRARSKAKLGENYAVEFWVWNGLPNDARAVTGYMFSRGADGDSNGDHLGIGGTHQEGLAGKLIFFNGNARNELLVGKRVIGMREWHHVEMVREGGKVTVKLDGVEEISGAIVSTVPAGAEIFIGGRSDGFAGLEGKMDEVGLFSRGGSRLLTSATTNALSAEESLKKIHVTPGFRVELVACEPAVLDPVGIDWDSDGRLWAVEMADYPMGIDGKGKAGGWVRVLEDADGDGRFEKGSVFADGLNFPTGLITWRDGVIVTAAPEILFLRDKNGDGRADERRVLFSGFLEGNQQLRINGLRWGLDGWIYCAIGGHYRGYGAETRIKSFAGGEVALGSRDFRFRADTGELEPLSGPAQFGRNRDEFGHWFGTQNSNPLWHYVIEDFYLRRNPHVPSIDPVRQLFTPANPKVFPRSAQEKRFHSFEHASHFTSACAGMIYQDELSFGRRGELQAFVCEPFHNLVQRQELVEEGVSFRARRAKGEEAADFFASEDGWCRPVMTRTGPDGALWVVDMYRYMIEHPDWLPAEGREELLPNYRAGDDKGRIYRVLPVGKEARKWPKISRMKGEALVRLLESPNGWLRDRAQMELIWRGDRSVTNALARVTSTPQARAQAMWTLELLGALSNEAIVARLKDENAGVRENALHIAEKRDDADVVRAAVALVNDKSAKVRLQLACSLGEWETLEAGQALAKLALVHQNEPYILAACMSSAVPHVEALVRAVRGTSALAEPLRMLCLGLGRRDLLAELLAPTLTKNSFGPREFEDYAAFLDLLRRKKIELKSEDDALGKLLRNSERLLEAARGDESLSAAVLLAKSSGDLERLAKWVAPARTIEEQKRAIGVLAETGDERVPELLFAGWATHGPETRSAIIEAMLRRESWALELLQRTVASDFDAARRARLQQHGSKRVREAAEKFFGAAAKSNRAEVVEAFRPVLALEGKAERGREIFLKACASCHKKNGEGREVGPDLQSVAEHAPEKMLANILDPSADIQSGFQAYTAQLANGEEVYGAIVSEAGNSVMMRLADGSARTILRSEVAAIRSGGLSLMPEGLEAGMTQQDMADLIAFLRAK